MTGVLAVLGVPPMAVMPSVTTGVVIVSWTPIVAALVVVIFVISASSGNKVAPVSPVVLSAVVLVASVAKSVVVIRFEMCGFVVLASS